MSLPTPSAEVGMKLASAIVHLRELISSGGTDADRIAAFSVIDSDDVRDYMAELNDLALLPVRRDGVLW